MATLPLPDDASDGELAADGNSGGPDVQLAYQVVWELLSDDPHRYRQIAVCVQNRVVILTGRAGAEVKEQAGQIALRSAGVTDVCNRIRPANTDIADGPDAGPAPGSTEEPTERQRFDEIVAGLAEDASRGTGGLPGTRRTWILASVALMTGTVWSALLVATVQFGWPVIFLMPVAVILLLTLPRLRRPRSGSRR